MPQYMRGILCAHKRRSNFRVRLAARNKQRPVNQSSIITNSRKLLAIHLTIPRPVNYSSDIRVPDQSRIVYAVLHVLTIKYQFSEHE